MKHRKFIFAFATLLIGISFISCDKDDQLDGNPESYVDPNYVLLDDKYGITAVCPIGEWSNSYIDTMPSTDRAYYAEYLYNCIFTGYLADSIHNEKDEAMYPNAVYFMRFHKILLETEVEDYIEGFKKTAYDNLISAYYTNVSDIKDTTLNEYKAYYFKAERGVSISSGQEEVFIMYYNGTLYGVTIIVINEYLESSYSKCQDIANTITLK